jgi:hypothetical protein
MRLMGGIFSRHGPPDWGRQRPTFREATVETGLPDDLFSNQNIPNLGIFWRVLWWKILEYFMTIWNILRPYGIFYVRLVYTVCVGLV